MTSVPAAHLSRPSSLPDSAVTAHALELPGLALLRPPTPTLIMRLRHTSLCVRRQTCALRRPRTDRRQPARQVPRARPDEPRLDRDGAQPYRPRHAIRRRRRAQRGRCLLFSDVLRGIFADELVLFFRQLGGRCLSCRCATYRARLATKPPMHSLPIWILRTYAAGRHGRWRLCRHGVIDVLWVRGRYVGGWSLCLSLSLMTRF